MAGLGRLVVQPFISLGAVRFIAVALDSVTGFPGADSATRLVLRERSVALGGVSAAFGGLVVESV